MLFNLAIDFIYREICDSQFAEQYGYKLRQGFDALSLTGFADDQVVTSSSPEAAVRIVEATMSLFGQIGLQVNPSKSNGIYVKAGKIIPGFLTLSGDMTIRCIDQDEKIKYLGCSFSNEMVFDRTIVGTLTERLNNLLNSPLLNRDQKLNVINQYLLPMLTYPLQSAPLKMIPKEDMVLLDRTIRSTIKGIIGLPISSPNDMFYAPRKYRGLGVVKCEWEKLLQHFSIAQRLSTVPDALFQEIYDCQAEMAECKQLLEVEGQTARKLRLALREKAFEGWSSLDYYGVGVKHFKTHPPANKFICDKGTLSGSEWVASIKLNVNYANLVGVPGISQQSQAIHCRRCVGGETQHREIPSHVLGFCSFGERRRDDRHNRIKHQVRGLLEQTKRFDCFDEVTCIDGEGRNKRIDILAFEKDTNKAYLIDPTIRYESNRDVDAEVQADKSEKYESCIPDIAAKYPQYGQRDFEVIGLWFGARGTISKGVTSFFTRFKLDSKVLPEMAEAILSDSVRMIHHHIYATN